MGGTPQQQVSIQRRKVLLAILSAMGAALTGCVTSQGPARPTSNQGGQSTSRKTAEQVFASTGNGLEQIVRQQAQFHAALASFRRDFVNGGNRSYESLTQRVTVPYVYLLSMIIAATEGKTVPTQLMNGKITIPPGGKLGYTQKGHCMDKSKPAPTEGDALELRSVSEVVTSEWVPVLQGLGVWSAANPNNQHQAQQLTWALMDLETERGDWITTMSPETRQQFDQILPGTSQRMMNAQQASKLQREMLKLVLKETKLDRYVTADLLLRSSYDPQAANQLLEHLIKQGQQSKVGKGIGYSTIAENIHTRAQGAGVLAAKVEVINDSNQPFDFSPMLYYAHPKAEKQRISPTPQITNVYLSVRDMLTAEQQQKAFEIAREVSQALIDELKDKIYDKVFDGVARKTPAAARAVRKLLRNYPKFGKAMGNLVSATPIVGNVISAYEFLSGRDITGQQLSLEERLLAGVGMIPGANTLRTVAKAAKSAKLSKASEKELFKFVDSREYGEIKTFLETANGLNEVFEDPGKALVKQLVVEAKLPWNRPTTSLLNGLKSGQFAW